MYAHALELANTASEKAADVLTHAAPAAHAGPVVATGAWGLAIWALVGVYVILVAILACFGFHRGMLVSTCWRKRTKLKEIERTVATKEHVELVVNAVVTREVQQLRVEMHQEFRRFHAEITQRLDSFQSQMTQRLDSQTRWLMTSTIVLFLAMLGNIVKDFLR